MRFDFAPQARVWAVIALCGVAAAAAAQTFPGTISLPTGWPPEGIAAGRGSVLYVGSLASGGVYALNPRTGEGQLLSPGAPGQVAVGLEFDRRTNLLPLGPGARPAPSGPVTDIPLSGDWQQVPGFNANGIVATPQGQLLVVHAALGQLYRVNPSTGVATLVNLGGGALLTAARFGGALYTVNARFGTPPAGTRYDVVRFR